MILCSYALEPVNALDRYLYFLVLSLVAVTLCLNMIIYVTPIYKFVSQINQFAWPHLGETIRWYKWYEYFLHEVVFFIDRLSYLAQQLSRWSMKKATSCNYRLSCLAKQLSRSTRKTTSCKKAQSYSARPHRWLGRKIFFCSISGTEFDHFWNWFGKNKFPGVLQLLK